MAIRVLQASAWYPPHHWGGTEVYLTGLVRTLRAHKIYSRIVAPLAPKMPDGYEFDGATVRTYSVNSMVSRVELRSGKPHEGFSRFSEILRQEKPNIYHQHSWSRGLGAAHLQAARDAGLRTVLTVHVPNNICMRGTMMRYGEEACDGRIDPIVCAACWSHGRGAPKPLALTLARIPSALGSALRSAGMDGRAATALSAQHLIRKHKAEFVSMIANADRIVAVCQWLYDALRLNGVPLEKLVLSRQGVDDTFAAEAARKLERSNACKFRLIYIGRWHPVKGVDLLVEAVRRIPQDVPFELVIHGVGNGPEESVYEANVRELAKGDSRILIRSPVPRNRLARTLSQANALAVPSKCMETGPLVILEAKASGLPVIGSRLGGIAELVREPTDGVLVAHDDVQAWSDAIKTMICDHTTRLPQTTQHNVRTMRDAAEEMAALYSSLC